MRVALVIPTYNAGNRFQEVTKLINNQKECLDMVKIIDSSSKDGTVSIAQQNDFYVEVIEKSKFSHGGTRREVAMEMYDKNFDYIIFMSQDVFLQTDALKNLIEYIINNPSAGVIFGKQEVDLSKGNLFEYYARNFNYPNESYIRTKDDIKDFGIKTIFSSDAFSIYNLKLLKKIDFFPNTSNVSEDMLVAHKFIINGYAVGYCAEAKVYHTHNYTVPDEFRRYKKIGKFYRDNNKILKDYGKTSQNGIKLAIGEIRFLISKGKISLIPLSLLRNASKFLGHKAGYYINE